MGYPPVVVVESGGVPRTQVAEGVSAPAFTVVESGARAITLADNAPPIALFNEDGTPYTGGGSGANAPAQFQAGDWSVADRSTVDGATITITALPSDGGSPITGLQYQVDGGAWASLGGTSTGDYNVAGLAYNTAQAIAVRAVNAVGNGTASATKSVTPTGIAETDALIARFTTPPTTARAKLIDNLIVAGKAHGWWAKLDVLCLIGADSQCSLLNWKSTSFNATTVNSPTFTADRQFATDGSTNYLFTNFSPAIAGGQFLQDDALFGVWHRKTAGIANSWAGWFDAPDGTTLNPRNNSNQYGYRINQAAMTNVVNSDGAGFFVAERSGPSATEAFKNGVSQGTGSAVSTALNNTNLNLGRATAAAYGAAEIAGWLIGARLGATMQADMYADILTYMQGIGAA